MMFSRRTRNRRMEREHVLDVKVRAQQVRQERARLLARVVTGMAGLLAVVFLSWRGGQWLVDVLLTENDAFALQVIDVRSDGDIPPDLLRRWAGVKHGDNLWALDLARIERDLLLAPLVKSVALEREFPYTLRIRVTEREPIAQVLVVRAPHHGGGFVRYFLDETGHVMLPIDGGRAVLGANPLVADLPALTGLRMSELRPGVAIDTPKVKAALRLIRAFEQSPMAGLVELRSLDVTGVEVIQVTTGHGSEVTFALDRIGEQLRRWRQIHDYGLSQQKVIATLDLSVTNNVPARWVEAGALTPVPPAPRSARSRRPHA